MISTMKRSLFLVCCLICLLSGELVYTNEICPEGVLNDDYCDCNDGSDENTTSACSHVGAKFACSSNGLGSLQLPTSRVGDGICDCCDGSDEALSPFNISCPNRCQEELNRRRKETLQMYRTIQAGLHTRHTLIDTHTSKHKSYVQNIERLQQEQQELESYAKTLRYHLQRETFYEDQMRWILLREREHQCANGLDAYCEDLLKPNFFSDDELKDFGFQAGMKREKNKNKNKNIDLNKRFVYAHTQSEIAYVYGQRGIHKVRSALCYNTSLLPDEDLRIFTTVGDYVSFMSSPGGKVYKQKIHTRYKREQSIFNMPNPYHTHTHTPNIVYIRVCEVMGVIASPLVGMAYVSGVMYQYVSKMVYGAIHALHTHYIHTRHIQGGDEVYAHPIHSVYDVMGRCAQVVMDMDNENSYVFKNYITYLYSDYNPLYALSNIVYGYLYYPAYTYTIMYYAPYLYFTYYTHTPAHSHTPSDSHTHADPYTYLPQRRQCCLLRVGLGYLQEELLKIQKKIRTLVQLQDMKATMSVVKEDAAEDANKDSVKNKKPWSVKNTIQSVKGMFSDVKETTSRRETRDYGILGEYESIKDVCVSKVYDTYNYTVCFFDRIIQTKVHTHTENGVDVPPSPSHTHTHTHTPRKEEYSLGKFSMWNISDPYPYTILNTYRDIQHHHHTQQQRTQHLYDNDGDVYGKMVSMGMEFLESMYVLPSYLFEQFVLKGLRQEDMSVVRGMLPFNHTLHPYYDRVMEYVYVYNQSMYDREGLLHTHTPSVEVQEIQSRLNREMDMYYGKQFYTDGTPCVIHNTPSPSSPHTPSHTHTQVIPRNTEVIFQCAADHEIVYVMEKSVCSYSITVTSPLACTERMEREFLDRLDALGVFGFSKKKG